MSDNFGLRWKNLNSIGILVDVGGINNLCTVRRTSLRSAIGRIFQFLSKFINPLGCHVWNQFLVEASAMRLTSFWRMELPLRRILSGLRSIKWDMKLVLELLELLFKLRVIHFFFELANIGSGWVIGLSFLLCFTIILHFEIASMYQSQFLSVVHSSILILIL